MKKILFILIILPFFATAQVAIGKTSVDGSGILDFPTGTKKGIILPNVLDNNNINPIEPRTLVFDQNTSKIKYYNGVWIELSDKTGISPTLNSGNDIVTNNGVIIGANSSSANGALVLESSNKALILPKIVDPVTNVKSPVAGMICYDPSKKLFCVYNGKDWYFWK